jgi:hypothetical protein
MKIKRKPGYILIIAPTLLTLAALPALRFNRTLAKTAKGAAFYPFIAVRDEAMIEPWLITHERIHHRQQIETLYLGIMLFNFCEKLYARIWLGYNAMDSYHYLASEQEAYRNQLDNTYLTTRRPFAFLQYYHDKQKFTHDGHGHITLQP